VAAVSVATGHVPGARSHSEALEQLQHAPNARRCMMGTRSRSDRTHETMAVVPGVENQSGGRVTGLGSVGSVRIAGAPNVGTTATRLAWRKTRRTGISF
jgi:hypothetical protein